MDALLFKCIKSIDFDFVGINDTPKRYAERQIYQNNSLVILTIIKVIPSTPE